MDRCAPLHTGTPIPGAPPVHAHGEWHSDVTGAGSSSLARRVSAMVSAMTLGSTVSGRHYRRAKHSGVVAEQPCYSNCSLLALPRSANK